MPSGITVPVNHQAKQFIYFCECSYDLNSYKIASKMRPALDWAFLIVITLNYFLSNILTSYVSLWFPQNNYFVAEQYSKKDERKQSTYLILVYDLNYRNTIYIKLLFAECNNCVIIISPLVPAVIAAYKCIKCIETNSRGVRNNDLYWSIKRAISFFCRDITFPLFPAVTTNRIH